MTPNLYTERLRLAPYTELDEDHFVALFRDGSVARSLGSLPASEAAYRALFRYAFRVVTADRCGLWGVWYRDRYIGHAEIKPTSLAAGHEIVYALTPATWGNGFGTEVARAVAAYGLETLGLTEVYATVAVANVSSVAVLTKAGFRHLRDIGGSDGTVTQLFVRGRPGATAGA